MANRMVLNETSYFGWNARENLVSEIKKRKFKRILVVSDENLVKCGVTGKVTDLLDNAKIKYSLFDKVKPNPTISNCHDGIKAARKFHADSIIAVGGGSVIDTAKCIGIVVNNKEFYDINSLEGAADTKNKSLPIIALPTTAGTAAEVTINYVITDEIDKIKRVCVDTNDIPVLSIVDTELMSKMPKMTAAATGLDALTHAMEGYITKAHWEIPDMFHLQSMAMTYKNLVKAVNKDKEAQNQMAMSEYVAGMGFSNVGLGIVHSMAHQLGATYDIAHGIACSLFLPYVLEWNGEVAYDRYRKMAEAFEISTIGKTDKQCVALVVRAVRDLEKTLKVPMTLKELNVSPDSFEEMAAKALIDPCTGGNPREVTKEDIIELFNRAYEGKGVKKILKTKVGYSENIDAYKSGVETARMAAKIENPQVGLLFTSCVQDQKEIIKGVKSVLKDVDVVGCTSSAAICTQDGYLNKETGYSGMMLLGGDAKVVAVGSPKTSDDAREIGKKLAEKAIKKADCIEKPSYVFVSASPKEEEAYLKGIADVIGDVPVFGGSAADNTVEGKWSLFYNDEVFSDGCVMALIYADTEIKNIYTGNYNETKDAGLITEVKDKRTLVSIDGKPALDVYAKWTGKNIEDMMGGNLLTETIFNPLGVKDQIGNVTAVRHPMFANVDKSMNIGANLEENTAIIHLTNTPEGMLDSNACVVKKLNSLMDNSPESYFLVHCGGRRLGLQLTNMEDKIYSEIKKAIPKKEFLMVFTFGEYGRCEHSSNIVGGLSLSFTGFGKE